MLEVHPLVGIGEVAAGSDLVSVLREGLAASGLSAKPDDVLVVTQKIVSKAEGRFVDLADVLPGEEALRLAAITRKDPRLVELALSESSAVLRAVPNVLITRHRMGWVMANAGIDRSNLGDREGEHALLLPQDPDESARRLAEGLGVPVVISDSFGRPWRNGVALVALGAAGVPSLIDRRGEQDRDGRTLEVTQIAMADMIANAAGLVMGEGAEGIPAALVRGLDLNGPPVAPASALTRPVEQDLFQ